ncbi:DUF1549 and DUF1553 domain-containing protein [Gimesia maris]|uniref:DUF1553 domain-containing protein n=1 Tax=Gimesia maris TaxID=122 RepID=A0ABX5YSX1_9PLAN|nr:DUF1549 and DUF1553 domain-containing protein [Gimesia maris]EDL60204.1 hypothetical protein PM8797T_20683 [Gimesia maris DSM 8797]QEG18680.1 hypothetical protein GmarT_45700 [Gimesia maris]QGQ28375.1 DUF1553 domain-containing protein [Gimesia maris]
MISHNMRFVLSIATLIFACSSSLKAEEAVKLSEEPITEADREHWSFQPIKRPALPAVKNQTWPRTPIDHFILAELESAELQPATEANRTTLIRRLYFDVIGLPPMPEEVETFLADQSPDAYDKLVDRLLASKHYGERWAQHWLDLARFAETDGYEHDKVRPDAWKYRDWVIKALNEDMPYDQFVRWQLAGDVIAPENPEAKIATAFCLSGPDMPDINSQEERRHTLLNEMTSTVGSAFMALQMGCAQCHDHKYDPISTIDFYRMRAFFEPAVKPVKNRSVTMLASIGKPVALSRVMIRGDWRQPGPRVQPAFLRVANLQEQAVDADDSRQQRREFAFWLTQQNHPLTSRVIVNRIWQHHFGRGLSATPSDFGLMGDLPTHPELLDWLAAELMSSGWKMKSLHRLILTSSVYRQAGQFNGSQASESAWKRSLKEDPDVSLLSRFPRQRLDAEVIRDAMLAVSGKLSENSGGRGVMPPLPRELRATLLKDQWKTSANVEDHYRRSIYVFARRNLRYPLFDVFDRPDANTSCSRRGNSTTAPQSLLMMNSESSLKCAQELAGLIWDQAGENEVQQVKLLFRRALGRMPTDNELDEMRRFLSTQQKILAQEQRSAGELLLPLSETPIKNAYAGAALTDLCLAIFNTSEFLYVD